MESTVWSPRCSGGRRPLRRNLDLHEPGNVQPCKTEGNPWWRENINQLCVLDLDASPVLILIITSELNPERAGAVVRISIEPKSKQFLAMLTLA